VRIDRCYCFGVPFAALRATAEATGARSVGELQRHVTFGQRCRLCHPYVRRMLRTGETVFGEIVMEEDEPPTGEPPDPG
jgi:bacterioferritin-associated ferredoxin